MNRMIVHKFNITMINFKLIYLAYIWLKKKSYKVLLLKDPATYSNENFGYDCG